MKGLQGGQPIPWCHTAGTGDPHSFLSHHCILGSAMDFLPIEGVNKIYLKRVWKVNEIRIFKYLTTLLTHRCVLCLFLSFLPLDQEFSTLTLLTFWAGLFLCIVERLAASVASMYWCQ